MGQQIDVVALANAMHYTHVVTVDTKSALIEALNLINSGVDGTAFINVNVHKGNRKNLGRPTKTPIENKEALMKFLQ